MSFAAAFFLIAQSAVPATADSAVSAPAAPVAESVTASVRVLRPARIHFDRSSGEASIASAPDGPAPQRGRDDVGTVWIEFS